jgi:glucose-1-phosphate adenylyltransferase
VGTVDAYYQANMDFLGDDPPLDVNDKTWPIYSFQPSFPPPKIAAAPPPTRSSTGPQLNIIANGTVSEGWLKGTVVGFDCRVEAASVVEDSILFDRVYVGSRAEVRKAILDKGVRVLPGASVGVDAEADRRRGFVRSDGGVTCVPKGAVVEPV